MKKFVLLFASLSLMVGLVGTEAASAAGPPAVSASHRAADLSKLNHSLAKLHKKKLTAKQASALGLHALSRDQVARLAKLQKSQAAKAADVGTYFWYQFQGSPGFLWVNRDYSGPYYSYPWYPYYVIYDNPYICTTGGGSCQQADTYFYSYYLYYYPNGTWYNYGPSGYTTGYQVGFGPYVYDIGV